MAMAKRLLPALLGAWLGLFWCSAAQAQVDKILGHIVSWVLQKQIDEWERANDTSRGLTEFNARDNFGSGDLYAPREQPIFRDVPDSSGANRDVVTVRQELDPATATAPAAE
jgi:hypothetical protein